MAEGPRKKISGRPGQRGASESTGQRSEGQLAGPREPLEGAWLLVAVREEAGLCRWQRGA